jgi:site-specific DNA recombinase
MAGRVGYERLSKDRSLRGINVAIQHAEIDEFAEDSGELIKKHFCDNDTSASEFGTKPRDGYLELLAWVIRGFVHEIIVTEIPRLTRRSSEAQELINYSKTTPLRYIKTTDDMVYDLHTPRGRKAFRDAVSDAEFESDQSSTRQGRKKNKQAEAGAFHGGQRPYAYEGAKYERLVAPDGKEFNGVLLNPGRVGRVIIKKEAAIRVECTQRIISGEREIDLVRDLNRRGIPAPDGGKWRIANLKRMLCRKRDVAFDEFPGKGTRVHKDNEHKAVWDAIISKEDYELMMAAFKLNSSGRKPNTVKGRLYLLSGIVRDVSGNPMYGRVRKMPDGTRQRRYISRAQDEFGVKIPGKKAYRSAEPVDLFVKEMVIARFNSPKVAAALAPSEDKQRVHELVTLQTKQKLLLQQLPADYGSGLFDTKEEYAAARDAAAAALATTNEELQKIQSTKAVATIPTGQTIAEFFDTARLEAQRKVILLLVDYVTILPGNPHGKMWRGFQFDTSKIKIVWKV